MPSNTSRCQKSLTNYNIELKKSIVLCLNLIACTSLLLDIKISIIYLVLILADEKHLLCNYYCKKNLLNFFPLVCRYHNYYKYN